MARTPKPFPPPAVTLVEGEVPGLVPRIDVPPHTARILGEKLKDPEETARDPGSAPRVGRYALVARFPSSPTADVFLGYKITSFGFLRRAVVKWVDRRRPDHAILQLKLADEARAISCLDHPNVVSIYDYAEDSTGTYMAVEYVAGTDLRRAIAELGRQGQSLPWTQAGFVVCELLRGLAHVHSAKDPAGQNLAIIHRDVSPSNILIGEDGRVKLTDFGTVFMVGRIQHQTAPGMVKGKVRYLAPEYIADQACTQLVDIYGAGVILFEMVAGQPSFPLASNVEVMIRIVREGLDYSKLKNTETPPGFIDIIRRATDRDPTRRYSGAAHMLAALEAFFEEQGVFASPTKLAEHFRTHQLFC